MKFYYGLFAFILALVGGYLWWWMGDFYLAFESGGKLVATRTRQEFFSYGWPIFILPGLILGTLTGVAFGYVAQSAANSEADATISKLAKRTADAEQIAKISLEEAERKATTFIREEHEEIKRLRREYSNKFLQLESDRAEMERKLKAANEKVEDAEKKKTSAMAYNDRQNRKKARSQKS